MPDRYRVFVENRDELLVSVNSVRWDGSADYVAENAVQVVAGPFISFDVKQYHLAVINLNALSEFH